MGNCLSSPSSSAAPPTSGGAPKGGGAEKDTSPPFSSVEVTERGAAGVGVSALPGGEAPHVNYSSSTKEAKIGDGATSMAQSPGGGAEVNAADVAEGENSNGEEENNAFLRRASSTRKVNPASLLRKASRRSISEHSSSIGNTEGSSSPNAVTERKRNDSDNSLTSLRNTARPLRKSPSSADADSLGEHDQPAPTNELSEQILEECRSVIETLDTNYGAASAGFCKVGDAVVVTEGWNKALAFKTMWSEAMVGRWRILVARDELKRLDEETERNYRPPASTSEGGDDGNEDGGGSGDSGEEKKDAAGDSHPQQQQQPGRSKSIKVDASSSSSFATLEDLHAHHKRTRHQRALDQVETNVDPLAVALESRVHHVRDLLVAMIDRAVRSLCPHSQRVQREAYRPINDDLLLGSGDANGGGAADPGEGSDLRRFALLEGTMDEYCRLFARCGVLPRHWTSFVDAFLWTMKSHNPYSDETDSDDLDLPGAECAHCIFAATYVAKPAVESIRKLHSDLDSAIYRVGIKRFWERISRGDAAKAAIGEAFYRELLTNHPELLDYFARADMDSLALHLVQLLDLLVKSSQQIGTSGTSFRKVLEHLGEMHRRLGIPTFAFPIVGGQLLKLLRPHLEDEERLTEGKELACTADELESAFAMLYMEIMAIVFYPMVQEEKLVDDAEKFFDTVAKELQWSNDRLSRRLLEVKLEIQNTGTYVHTSDELELGARLAWRNSAKCIGRIAWNTLMVRDSRHIESPREVFADVEEHLRIATAGTNIQSVMTVYKPKSRAEAWGMRFWSSQFVRYAGYREEDGSVTGDPGNLEFTEYLVKRKLWTPPQDRTHFDVLPLVLKVPGVAKPFVYQLPKQAVHEVEIEHPDCPAIKEMGLRWAAVPAISNFNMNLGGIDYQCCPFNGWFVSIEVVRNLMERYKVNDRWADAMKLDKSQKMLEMRIQHEIQVAVLHSFSSQGFTMVDPTTVGNSFLVHCKRERDLGRECPGQWSWIGGLVGPTNVTWHREMRDFELLPQYEYCCEHWMVTEAPETDGRGNSSNNLLALAEGNEQENDDEDAVEDLAMKLPRVLILFGSETGTAEAAANRLGSALRLLKPTVKSLDSVAGLDIVSQLNITHVVAICSTFNRGEFPSNAKKFEATPIAPGVLSNAKVAVLALGSSLYPDFCAAGAKLDGKLTKEGGGQHLVPTTKVDDATGSEGPISDWASLVRRLILPAHMEKVLVARAGNAMAPPEHRIRWVDADGAAGVGGAEDDSAGGVELVAEDSIPRFAWPEGEEGGGAVECVENEELMARGGNIDERSTRKLTFKLPDGVTYTSGDHLAVNPLNSVDMVMRFARCFGEELVDAATAGGSCPVLDKGSDAIVRWMLRRSFAVDTVDNGETYPAQVAFDAPATLAEVLQSQIDLSLRPSMVADLLALLKGLLDGVHDADLSSENREKKRRLMKFHRLVVEVSGNMKKAGCDEFLSHFPTVVDFLEHFRTLLCEKRTNGGEEVEEKEEAPPLLSLAQTLVFLPRLQMRYYSISSSPKADPTLVSISVGVLHAETSAGVALHGVCSNYLARIRPKQDRVSVSVRTSSFRGPKDLGAPVVMVGAGTGLAPMMGFLSDRAHAMEESDFSESGGEEIGECHLYFGCRNEDDRIYTDTVDKWVEQDVVRLHLALSRAAHTPKTYVQDLLAQSGKDLCRLLLQSNSHYYICGDAKVADFCFESCVSALRQHGNMSRVAAVQHIKMMRAQGRWQYDLWGIISHFNEAKRDVRAKKEASAKTWLLGFADQ